MVREFMEYRPYVSIQEFRRGMASMWTRPRSLSTSSTFTCRSTSTRQTKPPCSSCRAWQATAAAELAAGRPYASNDAFLQKLAEVAPQADVAAAAAYLVSE